MFLITGIMFLINGRCSYKRQMLPPSSFLSAIILKFAVKLLSHYNLYSQQIHNIIGINKFTRLNSTYYITFYKDSK